MNTKNNIIIILFAFILAPFLSRAQTNIQPTKLTVNFILHPDRVFLNGYPVNVLLYEAVERKENLQFVEITQQNPFFGWVVNSGKKNTLQTGYQIIVASSMDNIQNNNGDMWDSGKVQSDQSINVSYLGKSLKPNSVYFWKVKTWNNHNEESPYSYISQFKMAAVLSEQSTAQYPLQKQDVFPVSLKNLTKSLTIADFGKDAYGRIRVTLFGKSDTDTVCVNLGEALKHGRIDSSPKGTIRYSSYKLPLMRGWNTYTICITPDKRNTLPIAVRMPDYIGEVLPFRYCEVEGYEHQIKKCQLVRETEIYPFDELASFFTSSDTVLNQVWDLCKYSMKATTFANLFVDSDRERIPYEGDVFMNQLAYYGVNREYSIARSTHEYLINHPTWPTEWIMHSILLAWYDYLYTGNRESLVRFYNDLKQKTLIALADKNGFISSNGRFGTQNTNQGKITPQLLKSIKYDYPEFKIAFSAPLKDLIDWPQAGLDNGHDGMDGFVFKDINTVINAYHYRALVLMSKIAEVLGELSDQETYALQANKLEKTFNRNLMDRKTGLYFDGIGTDHKSLHGNMFPLSLGLVPEKNVERVFEFVKSKGMACQIYGSLVLLKAIYDNNFAEYGLKLLTSTSDRSWYNMIRSGSTITMEAWDLKYKWNCGWNQPAGAVPAYIIPCKLMGIEPLEPGFKKIRIKPQPASLEKAEIKYPTIRGDVFVSFNNKPRRFFSLDIAIPANTTADVYLPFFSKDQIVLQNGIEIRGNVKGNFLLSKMLVPVIIGLRLESERILIHYFVILLNFVIQCNLNHESTCPINVSKVLR